MPKLRVATWNVWWRFGPWQARQERIATVLRDAAPDVVCLQEAYVAPDDDQPARLAGELGLEHHAYASLVEHDGVRFGNAILSRHPIVMHQVHQLPALGTYDEKRTLLVAEIAAPRRHVHVATTHLNFRWDQGHVRQAQVRFACDVLGRLRPFATAPVLCGDLNAGPDSDEIRLLTGRSAPPVEGLGFHDAWETAAPERFDPAAGITWDRRNEHTSGHEPDRRIDYLLVGYPVQHRGGTVDCRRLGDEPVDGGFASDHYGLLATIQY